MRTLPRHRRLTCAFAGIVLGAIVLHGQLADALVTRGDDALHGGDLGAAIRAYRVALWFDPHLSLAADRLAFFLDARHAPRDAQGAVAVATTALAAAPDANLLADRALAEIQLRRFAAAEVDFAAAGSLARDARYEQFAARLAFVAGQRRRARDFARAALAIDPGFTPARHLLRTLP